ncbi:hypothetical protein DPMN_071316 [Dreissena polymorpha]|uniref:Uncharacterized protein n=1 Tax=Dreissena polymorpha TaxID=45954 RepID=A0A9D3Z2D4_DREPO|nr:hypothetical protein DPMN_071316 [Dreissena polymorpha]
MEIIATVTLATVYEVVHYVPVGFALVLAFVLRMAQLEKNPRYWCLPVIFYQHV